MPRGYINFLYIRDKGISFDILRAAFAMDILIFIRSASYNIFKAYTSDDVILAHESKGQ